MSASIDERIVRMEFDDSGFEAGAVKAIEILGKLKDALNFEGAESSINNVKDRVSSFDLKPLGDFSQVKQGWTWFDSFTHGIFSNIGKRISDFAIDIGKKLTISPIAEGFGEYETQMRSIQTIQANTGRSTKDINKSLDELNEYADLTIYKFADMTHNIGTLTTAGVGLEDATTTIKGFSNAAALAGADTTATSRAMIQFSQAMSSGAMRLQDWHSLEQSNIASASFVENIKATARAHGIQIDDMIAKEGSFRETLKDGWFTQELMVESLEHMTYGEKELAKAGKTRDDVFKELVEKGYTEESANQILDMATAAERSATEIRTWSQLWDTVGESLGSGWATTFRHIVGDFDDATQFFTWLGDKITGVVNASNEARNNMVKAWAEAGGREALYGTVANVLEMVGRPLKAIGDAFNSVFGISAEQLVAITNAIGTFTQGMIISEEGMTNLRRIAEAVFDAIKTVLDIVTTFGDVIGTVIGRALGNLTVTIPGLFSDIGELATLAYGLFMQLADAMGGFANYLKPIRKPLQMFIHEVLNRFRDVLQGINEKIKDGSAFKILSSIIGSAIKIFASAVRIFLNFKTVIEAITRTAWTLAQPFIELGVVIVTWLLEKIADLSVWVANVTTDFASFVKHGLGPVRDFIRNTRDAIVDFYNSVKDTITGSKTFSVITEWISFLADAFGKFMSTAGSVGEFLLGVLITPFGILKDIFLAFINSPIAAVFGDILGAIMGFADTGLATALSVLSAAFQGLFDVFISPAFSALQSGIDWIKGINFSEIFSNFSFTNTFNSVKDWFSSLSFSNPLANLFVPKEASDSIEQTAGKIDNLKTSTDKAAGGAKDFVTQIANSAKSTVTGGFTKLINSAKDAFSGLKKSLSEHKDGIKETFNAVKTMVTDKGYEIGNLLATYGGVIKGKLSEAVHSLGETLKGVPGKVREIFYNLKSVIGDNLNTLIQNIVKFKDDMTGVIKEIFSQLPSLSEIMSSMSGFFGDIKGDFVEGLRSVFSTDNLPDLGGIFDFSSFQIKLPDWQTPVQGALDDLNGMFDRFPIERMQEITDGLVGTGSVGEKLISFGGKLVGLKWVKSIADINSSVAKAAKGGGKAAEGLGQMLEKMPDTITKSLTNMGKGFSEGLGKGLTAPLDTFGKTLKDVSKNLSPFRPSLTKNILNIATAIALLAGAAWVLAQIPADRIQQVGQAMLQLGAAAVGAVAILGLIQGILKSDMGGVGIALAGFGIGILALVGALYLLTNLVDNPNFDKGMKNLKDLATALAVMMAVMAASASGNSAGALAGLALAIIAFTAAVTLAIIPITILAFIPQDFLDKGEMNAARIGGFLTLCMMLIEKVSGGTSLGKMLGTSIAMIALAATITAMIVPITLLGIIPPGILHQGGNAVALIAGVITALVTVLEYVSVNALGILGGSVAAGLLAVAITLLIIPISVLGVLPPGMLHQGGNAVALISGVLTALVTVLEYVALNAGGIFVAAASMIVLDIAIAGLAAVIIVMAGIAAMNPEGMLTAMGACVVIVGSLAALALVGAVGGTGLLLLAAGVAAFGLALVVLAAGIMALQNGPDWASLFDSMSNLGRDIIDGLTNGIGNAVGNLVAKAKESAGKLVEGFRAQLRSNSPSLEMQDVGNDAMEGFINGVTQYLGQLLSTGEENSQEFTTSFDELPEKLGQKAREAVQGFIDGLDTEALSKSAADCVAGFLAGLPGALWDSIKTKGAELGNNFLTGVKEFLGINSPSYEMQLVGQGCIEGMALGLEDDSSLTTKEGEIVQNFLSGFAELPGNLGAKAVEAIQGFAAGVSNSAGEATTSVSNMGTSAAQGAVSFATGVANKAREGLTQFTSNISNKAGAARNAMNSVCNQAVSATANFISQMRSKANEAINGFVNAISSGAGRAHSAVRGVIDSAASAIYGLYDRFWSTGRSAVSGLVDGINSMLGSAYAKAAELASVAAQALNSKLKVNSPSKVTMETGHSVGEGFILGMDQMIEPTYKSAANLANTIPEAFTDALSAMSVDIEDILDTDYNPVITPVINSASFDSSMTGLSDMLNNRIADNLAVGSVNYSAQMATKFDDFADSNKLAMKAFADNAIDYNRLGVAVANALISSGVRVEVDGGQLLGYIAGEVADARRQYSR